MRRLLRPSTFVIAALILLIAVGVVVTVHNRESDTVKVDEGQTAFGQDPQKLPYNPQKGQPGGEFTPSPSDVFSPPDAAAETYPGFPPGTRFLPESLSDRLTVSSVRTALAFYRTLHMRPPCGPVEVTRYVDPDKQTIARSTVNGCHLFIQKVVKVPKYQRSWSAMGYCNLIVHEVGHSVGLGHSPNPQDIMFFQGNSRARTGCERFAPSTVGTVALPGIPLTIRCMDGRALQLWMTGQPNEALKESQKESKLRSRCMTRHS